MNFACVCYGDKYPVEYVQKLYNMVQRNTTIEHKFYVFTDHVKMQKMVEGDIHVHKFPRDDIEGWWNKLQLFHPDTPLEGTTLYMDLDVVITQNIDCFFTYKPEMMFVGMNDFRASLIFDGVPWSTDRVLETSLVIAQKNQLGVTLLEELKDLDTLQDLEKSSINLCDFEC